MRKNYALSVVALLLVNFLISGCAHSHVDGTNQVQVGMTKAEVLELAGNPNHTGRKLNSDVWLYVYGDAQPTKKTEIFFQDGKVSYIGEPKIEKSPAPKASKDFRPIGEGK